MSLLAKYKGELIDTNAKRLQPSLGERMVASGHGYHTALHFGVKPKGNQDKFLRCICYLNSIKTIKQDVLLNLVLVRQHNVLHY